MHVPDIDFTLAEFKPSQALCPVSPGDFARLVFVDARREEALWVCVTQVLQHGTHRAKLVDVPEVFTELAYSEFVYFRPEHVERVMTRAEYLRLRELD